MAKPREDSRSVVVCASSASTVTRVRVPSNEAAVKLAVR